MQLQVFVENKRVADLMINAIESGSPRYWCAGIDLNRSNLPTPAGVNWYEDERIYVDPNLEIEVQEHPDGQEATDGEDLPTGKTHLLTAKSIREGMEKMALHHGRHFGDFLSENDDAETADVFLQLCTFGELVYG